VEEKKKTHVESKTEEEPFRSKDGDSKVNKETNGIIIPEHVSHRSASRERTEEHDEKRR
jgi:hypothetical protein